MSSLWRDASTQLPSLWRGAPSCPLHEAKTTLVEKAKEAVSTATAAVTAASETVTAAFHSAKDAAQSMTEKAKEGLSSASEKAKEGLSTASEKTATVAAKAQETAVHVQERAQEMTTNASEKMSSIGIKAEEKMAAFGEKLMKSGEDIERRNCEPDVDTATLHQSALHSATQTPIDASNHSSSTTKTTVPLRDHLGTSGTVSSSAQHNNKAGHQ